MVYYGHFSYEAVMNMPISKRREMYRYLVKYKQRDDALANGQNPPPIDSSDVDVPRGDIAESTDPEGTIERMIKKLKTGEDKKKSPKPQTVKDQSMPKSLEQEESHIPSAIKEALDQMKRDGLVKESGELIISNSIEDSKPQTPKKKLEVPKGLQDFLSKVEKIN